MNRFRKIRASFSSCKRASYLQIFGWRVVRPTPKLLLSQYSTYSFSPSSLIYFYMFVRKLLVIPEFQLKWWVFSEDRKDLQRAYLWLRPLLIPFQMILSGPGKVAILDKAQNNKLQVSGHPWVERKLIYLTWACLSDWPNLLVLPPLSFFPQSLGRRVRLQFQYLWSQRYAQ